jgi:hypothetical protein
MIIQSEQNEIERSGDFKSETFECDPFVMTILRNNVYSDKITAAMREIITNSSDSHAEAGFPEKPIDVYLPSVFEPTFRVRDYGKSMSHGLVYSLYRIYGRSTKRDSNQSAGGFGIGKMAPICYTESNFQLTCVQNKTKRIYSIYVNETGKDSIDLLFSGDCDEPDGTEVSFPVKQSDINTFKTKLENLLRFWPTYPNVHNCENFQKIRPAYFLVRDGEWGFLNERDYYRKGSFIVSGPIAYKLDVNQIPDLSELQKKILDKNLVIFANIGDIALQASRESVGYNAQTILFVKNRLKKIEDEIRAEADKKQAALTSEYEARKLYFDLFNTAGQFGALAGLFKSHIEVKWDNKTITSPNFSGDTFDGFVAEYYKDRQGKSRVRVNGVAHWAIIQNEGKAVWRLFFDVKSMGKGKIRKMIRHYAEGNILTEGDDIFIIQVDSVEQLNQICAAKGINPAVFKDIHEEIKLPVVPRAPKTASTYSNCKIYDPNEEFDGDIVKKCEEGFIKANVDMKDNSGYFLIRNYSDYFFKGSKPAGQSVHRIWNALMQFDPEFKDNPVIYTFSQAEAGKLTNNWRNIDEALKLFIPVWEAQNQTTRINHDSLEDKAQYFSTMLEAIRKDIKFDEYESVRNSIDFTSRLRNTNMTRRLIGLGEITDANYATRKHAEKAINGIYDGIQLLEFVGYHNFDKKFQKFFVNYMKDQRNKIKENILDEELVTA